MTVTESVDVMYSITLHQWLTVKLLQTNTNSQSYYHNHISLHYCSQLESLKTKTVDKFLHDKNIGGINERLLSPVPLKLCIIGNYSSCSS